MIFCNFYKEIYCQRYEHGWVWLKGVFVKNWVAVAVEAGLHLFTACVLLRVIFFFSIVSESLGESIGSGKLKN